MLSARKLWPHCLIAAACLLAACGGAAKPAGAGGTFVMAINADPPTLNPSWSVGQTHLVGCKIMEGLVAVAPDGHEVRPELASSWDISPDQLTYTFHLRQNVQWHDGQPFSSDDVKWSLENLNKFHPVGRASLEKITSIDTPDGNTVVIHLKDPFAPFINTLTCPDGGAISPKHIGQASADPRADAKLNQAPIGTGPFVFKEWLPGDRVTLTRNPKYWKGQGLPYLDQVVVRIIPDNGTMIQALRAGEIDYIYFLFVTRNDVVRLQSQNDGKVEIHPENEAPVFDLIQLNDRHAPLNNVEVRRALLMALNRDLILKDVYKGLGTLEPNMLDSRLAVTAAPDIDLQKMYPFDPAKANSMLDQAGLPKKADGNRFELRLSYETGRGEWKDVAEIARSNWADVGVKVNLEPLERTVMLDKVYKKRDFDTTIQGYASRGDPALGVSRAFVCEDDKDPPTFGNPTGYCRKDVDDLFAQAARTADFDKRHQAYQQIQKILADDLPEFVFIGEQQASLSDKKFDLSAPRKATSASSGWEYVKRLP
jgi:peptide/nickel transport system substrate-binding protein